MVAAGGSLDSAAWDGFRSVRVGCSTGRQRPSGPDIDRQRVRVGRTPLAAPNVRTTLNRVGPRLVERQSSRTVRPEIDVEPLMAVRREEPMEIAGDLRLVRGRFSDEPTPTLGHVLPRHAFPPRAGAPRRVERDALSDARAERRRRRCDLGLGRRHRDVDKRGVAAAGSQKGRNEQGDAAACWTGETSSRRPRRLAAQPLPRSVRDSAGHSNGILFSSDASGLDTRSSAAPIMIPPTRCGSNERLASDRPRRRDAVSCACRPFARYRGEHAERGRRQGRLRVS